MALGGEIFQNSLTGCGGGSGGKVKVNGERVKTAKAVRLDDE